MTPEEYIHNRDLYYVVRALHMLSLEFEPSYTQFTYELKNHRSLKSPPFRDQRKIFQFLHNTGVIVVDDYIGLKGNAVVSANAMSVRFHRDNADKLKDFFWQLMYKLEEANLNHISFNQKEKIWLTISQGVIFVHLPLLVLRVNQTDLKSNNFPESFFIFLIEKGGGKIYTRDNFPHKTSRAFSDMVTKAGFNSLLRKLFVPVLDDSQVQLLTSVKAPLRDITNLTDMLIKIPENKNVYEKYMKNIDLD